MTKPTVTYRLVPLVLGTNDGEGWTWRGATLRERNEGSHERPYWRPDVLTEVSETMRNKSEALGWAVATAAEQRGKDKTLR